MKHASSFGRPDIRKEPVFIYGLAEPGTMTIRYVGKSVSPKLRLSGHLAGQTYRMSHWVQSLRAKSQRPRLLILLRVESGEDAAEAERTMISLYDRGQLLNGQGVRGQKKLDLRNPTDREFLNEVASGDPVLRGRLDRVARR